MALVNPFNKLRTLIRDGRWHLATPDCRTDVLGLGLTVAQAGGLLLRLRGDDYKGTFGPCDTDFGRMQGDYFLMWVDTDRAVRCLPGEGVEVYIKLGIGSDAFGEACLVASFHRSNRMNT
jgi:hypothetical protein